MEKRGLHNGRIPTGNHIEMENCAPVQCINVLLHYSGLLLWGNRRSFQQQTAAAVCTTVTVSIERGFQGPYIIISLADTREKP